MIIIKKDNSDIFKGGHDGIVIPVNCVGVAGKGLALKAKILYPNWYVYYKKACEERLLDTEKWFFTVSDNLTLISFPTKNHWKENSNLQYIKEILNSGFFEKVADYDLHYIGIPALGCGLGGLNWVDVKKEIIEAYENAKYKPGTICLYPPR